MSWHRSRCTVTLAVSLSMLAHAPLAHAQENRKPFNIAQGPALDSINEFARQAGISVLASGDNLAGIVTNAVQGTLPVAQALERLLAGTGLTTRINSSGAVFVLPVAVPAPVNQPGPAAVRASEEIAQVVVVGQRQSEQSSIERKKTADTARDAIVADDVGSFPDRNVAEAISRIAGVALERGEFGEGTHVSVRGNTADLTRVEIDGMIVAAPGGTDLTGGGGGRGIELRELPSDLIASVDVVKDSSAELTEGSLGGSIIIKTRTGLDFKKRTISLRASAQMNTINEKWRPNLNLIFADRFLDKRLGLVANISKQSTYNESHYVQHNQDIRSAYARDVDVDQSPEKTFALNPAGLDLSQPAATAPVFSTGSNNGTYAVTDGGAPFANLTPAEIIRRSHAAQTKEDCFQAFPLAAPQFARINTAVNRAFAQNHRTQELRSCLNQWNDYTPSLVRYFNRTQQENRLNGDLRVDFKVNSKLTVFAKFNKMNRDIVDTNNAIGMGNFGTNSNAANFDQAPGSQTTPYVRTLNAAGTAAGLSLYPGNYNSLGVANNNFLGMYNGIGLNVLPGTLKVDNDHHVTEAVLANASFTNDMINQTIHSSSRTRQFGATWRSGRLRAELMHGMVESDFWRYGLRSSLDFRYGPARMYVSPDGVWQYDFSGRVDPLQRQLDPALYGNVGAPAAPGLPARENSGATTLRVEGPRAGEMNEKTTRIDLSYALGHVAPFLRTLKFGISHRAFDASSWVNPAAGSGTVITPNTNGQSLVVLPSVARNSLVHVCEDTPASLAPGGTPCSYGFVPNATRNSVGSGDYYLNTASYRHLVAQALAARTSAFFKGADRGPSDFGSWAYLDAAKAFALLGVPPVDVSCIKNCKASDGNYYEQPRTAAFEQVDAGYLSTNFAFDRMPFSARPLPFGWELTGNLGYRVVRTAVNGRASMTFTAITTNPDWDPVANNDAVTTTTMTRNVTLSRRTNDYMPSLNLALWTMPGRLVWRYHRARTIARPPISRLGPGGVICTYDERHQGLNGGALQLDDDALFDSSCNNVMGNPALRAQSNLNQSLALEWYPRADSNVSLAVFSQQGQVGAAVRTPVVNQRPFAGSDLVLPDGRSLADVQFKYDTWMDGPANSRKGIELSARTAFTSLPSLLRHTGINANFTKLKSRNVEGQVFELMSGDILPPLNEYRYSWNSSLWYDDGRLNMRVALQVNTQAFTRHQVNLIATNPFPTNGVDLNAVTLPLLPPPASFRDARRFVDARIGYKFSNGIEVFAEGRNLGNKSLTNSGGDYGQFSDGRALMDMGYSGRRVLAGVVIRN